MTDPAPATPPTPTLAERLDAAKQRYEGGLGYWHVLTVEDAELVARAFAADQVAQMDLRFATIEAARQRAEAELDDLRARVKAMARAKGPASSAAVLGSDLARERAEREREAMRGLVLQGLAVVDDFLPNIGRCALQDIGRLNSFCIEARKMVKPPPAGPETGGEKSSA